MIEGEIEVLEVRELEEATVRMDTAIKLATTEVKPNHVTRQTITRDSFPRTTISTTLVPR